MSDMFGGGLATSYASSGVAERNLNRLTISVALVWTVTIILIGLMTHYVGKISLVNTGWWSVRTSAFSPKTPRAGRARICDCVQAVDM